jgi:ribose-phosphate pyrophosphokinase
MRYMSVNSNKVILAGSNSRNLANSIGELYDIPVLQHKVIHFINSEIKINLPFKLDKNSIVWVVQSTSLPSNDNLMELFLTIDTLQTAGVEEINLVVPYFGYARQDKQHLPGECMSMAMISKIFKSLGVNKIVTCDIHNATVLDEMSLDVEDLSTLKVLAKKIYKDLGLTVETEKDFIIASPDQGGVFRAELFAKNFFQDPANYSFVSVKKERELSKIHYSQAVELYGEINRPKLILIDDVSTSGGTIFNAIELIKANNLEEIYTVIVHADFASGVIEKFDNSEIKKLYTTNTIEKPIDRLEYFDKVKVFDIAESIKLD